MLCVCKPNIQLLIGQTRHPMSAPPVQVLSHRQDTDRTIVIVLLGGCVYMQGSTLSLIKLHLNVFVAQTLSIHKTQTTVNFLFYFTWPSSVPGGTLSTTHSLGSPLFDIPADPDLRWRSSTARDIGSTLFPASRRVLRCRQVKTGEDQVFS